MDDQIRPQSVACRRGCPDTRCTDPTATICKQTQVINLAVIPFAIFITSRFILAIKVGSLLANRSKTRWFSGDQYIYMAPSHQLYLKFTQAKKQYMIYHVFHYATLYSGLPSVSYEVSEYIFLQHFSYNWLKMCFVSFITTTVWRDYGLDKM